MHEINNHSMTYFLGSVQSALCISTGLSVAYIPVYQSIRKARVAVETLNSKTYLLLGRVAIFVVCMES